MVNVVVDALSRKNKVDMNEPKVWDEKSLVKLKRLGLMLKVGPKGSLILELKEFLYFQKSSLFSPFFKFDHEIFNLIFCQFQPFSQ